MKDNVRSEEEQNLERCISRIDEIMAEARRFLSQSKGDAPVSGETARVMRRIKEEDIRNLTEARQSPYFGRVDFINQKTPERSETYYFGKYHIPLDYVFNWQAPVGRLFYQPLSGEYESPAGKVKGAVTLKRELLIEQSLLANVIEVPLLPPAARVVPAKDELLTRELSKSKGDELREIVATIQPEQYEQIASAPYRVLIIQGVAGSGKSEVGLHRIAYLLSPHNELDLRISPNRVAFFGPSGVFLKYVSNLLPGLGVERVRQMTIREWLRSTLPSRVRVERGDVLLERLLKDSKKKWAIETRMAKLKVSLQMAHILDGYVQALRTSFVSSATSISRGNEVLISKTKVKKIIRVAGNQPLNEQRRIALSRIEQEVQRGLLTKLDDSLRDNIRVQFQKFWPDIDYRHAYLKLLTDQNTLITAINGAITDEEAEYFGKSLSGKGTVIKTEDLPAISYLNYLLNGLVNKDKKGSRVIQFEHVVIDEAQDTSPIEFLLLYLYSTNKSFTILGDVGQCILPHRGITNWKEVQQIFSKERAHRSDIRVSYRATYEIAQYANRILKVAAPGMPKAIPYERHGEKPVFTRSKTYSDMVRSIAEDIRSLRGSGIETIAVLCKTSSEASKLEKRLRKERIDDAILLDKPGYERTKIAVSSIYLTKGLEYDAVVLANARKNNFTASMLHNRLLYIAVTRAAHYLHIHWFGTLAEALVDPMLIRKTKKGKARKKQWKSKKTKSIYHHEDPK